MDISPIIPLPAFGALSRELRLIPFFFGSEFSFLLAHVVVGLTTDSICTKDLGIQVEMGFLYFQLQAVRSLLRRLALLLGHDLAVPDMVILYHTFMNLGRAALAWEDGLRPVIAAGFHTAIPYSEFVSPYYLPPNTAAACCSMQTRGAGSSDELWFTSCQHSGRLGIAKALHLAFCSIEHLTI
jgi:hypothetical protein